MRKYLVEFIGMFFLVLTVGMTVYEPGAAGEFASFAVGLVLLVMVYAGGHVLGGHVNLAVAVVAWLRRCAQLHRLVNHRRHCGGIRFPVYQSR